MKLFTDHKRISDEMLITLNGIEAEIDATLSLNHRALQTLGINRTNGWCAELHSTEAEELWNKQLKITPSDTDTIHHLAILHHARAFDFESGDDSKKSDNEWEIALKYWNQLLKNDDFWNRLTENSEGIAISHIKQLKEEYPKKILAIHIAIAYSPKTSLSRAKFHIKHALKSDSDPEILNDLRTKIYERFINDFPDEIWVGSTTDISILNEACNKIKKILDVDPECLSALMDIIRIQYRVLESLAQKKYENQDDEKQVQKIRTELNENANEWQAYFDLCLLTKEHLSYDLIENLVYWYRFMGNNKADLREWKGAIQCFENIILLDFDEGTLRQDTLETIPIYHSLYARDLVDQKSESAKAECNKAAARNHHTPASCYYLAQAYQGIYHKASIITLTLQERDNAITFCEKGISLSGIEAKKDSILWHERLVKLKFDIILQKAIEGALDCLEHKEFDNAIKYLNEAIDKGIEHPYLYLYRCRCYIESNKINEAKLDLKKADELAQKKDERDAVLNLRKQIEGLDFTGKYMQPALDAMKNSNFKKAIEHLTEAIQNGYSDCLIYIIRCQCHFGLNDLDKATTDLKKAETLIKTDADRKDVQDLKKYLSIDPPTGEEINQLANELIQQFKAGLPSNIKFKESICLTLLIKLIKAETKKWSKNSMNSVAENFMNTAKDNFDYYCSRSYFGF